jgi:hypothetical protein
MSIFHVACALVDSATIMWASCDKAGPTEGLIGRLLQKRFSWVKVE